jgi:hypothetical protein
MKWGSVNEPRSPGTPAYPHWEDRAPGVYAGRTSQTAAYRSNRRAFFPPPREANEPRSVVTEDAFDEPPRSEAGESVCVTKPTPPTYLGHRQIVPNFSLSCIRLKRWKISPQTSTMLRFLPTTFREDPDFFVSGIHAEIVALASHYTLSPSSRQSQPSACPTLTSR